MADRLADVLLLVASRHDGLWLPPGALRTVSGFAPGVLEPCRTCDGSGKVRDRFGRRTPCARCQGRGRVAFDSMDSLHMPVGSSETASTARPRRTVRCDACDGEGVRLGERCAYCDGAGRRDLHAFELAFVPLDAESDVDPVDAAIERRNDAGSYHELDRALAALRARSVVELRALLALAETGERSDAADAGLAFVAARMPDPVKVPAAVRANARLLRERRTRAKGRGSHPRALEQRAEEMRKLARDGKPAQWIAAEYEVSVATVYEVVNGCRP